jgi:hypothetical protein
MHKLGITQVRSRNVVGVEKNKNYIIRVCVCSLMYPPYKSHLYMSYYIAVSGLVCCTAFWHIIL